MWGWCGGSASAEEVYLDPADFIAQAFPGQTPQVGVFAIDAETDSEVRSILNKSYRTSRIRYWQVRDRTAWILEEIGKTKPITTGLVVEGGKIDSVQVLIYRESHGWEVRRPAFTRQFQGATLKKGRRMQLSKRINGISGATLSVNALTKLSELALLFHEKVSK